MTKKEALAVINAAPKRVREVRFQLQMHLNAAPGGTSILQKREDFHGITQITRTPKRKGGGYGLGRNTWLIDGDEEELATWDQVILRIAERVRAGHYAETGGGA